MEETKAIRQTSEDDTQTAEEIRKELQELLGNLSHEYLLSVM